MPNYSLKPNSPIIVDILEPVYVDLGYVYIYIYGWVCGCQGNNNMVKCNKQREKSAAKLNS